MENQKIVPCGYCKKAIHINDFGGVQKDVGFFHSECHLEAERQALKQADVIGQLPPTKICDCSKKYDFTASFTCDGRCFYRR